MPIATIGYAAPRVGAIFEPCEYELRDLRDTDVLLDVHYCGVCAGDVAFRDMPIFNTQFPYVGGHEVAGIVSRVGPRVSNFKPGDRVGVGCFAHCCNECNFCKSGKEQYCPKSVLTTGGLMPDGEVTHGGFGKQVVCEEQFVFRIPDSIPLQVAAPLFCAGITTYSPAKKLEWHKGGMNIGVVGLGGLGHVAVQWAKVMGNSVTLITRNMNKAEEAKALGVDKIIVSSDEEALAAAAGSLHHILDTAGNLPLLSKLHPLLRPTGTLALVTPGHSQPLELMLPTGALIFGATSVIGSKSGTLSEHREMLELAAKHKVFPVVEVVKGEDLNKNLSRLQAGTVKFRLVIDMQNSGFKMPIRNIGWAAPRLHADFELFPYTLRALREDDVLIDVHYCGICHGDLAFRELAALNKRFPLVAGHEIAGVVSQVGSKVTKFKPGDRVGVGCLCHCCKQCVHCKTRQEHFCAGLVGSYGDTMPDGEQTFGGYSKHVVCEEDFVFRIPDEIPLQAAAPMLCAGVTTYSPAKKLNWHKGGMHVGVVGLGGLGHMAVQFAKAMGNSVTLITRSMDKAEDAKKLGVDRILVSSDEEAMKAAAGSLHHILDTTGKAAVVSKLFALLRPEGVIVMVAADWHGASMLMPVSSLDLIINARGVMGTHVGSPDEHREMLDFAAKHNIRPVIELITAEEINQHFPRVAQGTVKFRLVVDIKASKFVQCT
eukprot:Gregarina_sp_Pseudo_9__5424@NODE_671_length_2392_cov_151_796855_g634_i0_p1_GENE_NODE_671_length_2392_cov_151_796855_g634_i0NODE_671_length_2392_cov_151_796855_g634_i0_p1_ORF_typecomplete_len711_score154_21ADH_N/PF08240_12/2_9e28ADH_N/PF08240_12/1_2e27ADH_zinc_N/PF00107_26/1_7e15ADH_zinc_N/PF00107_26/3e20Glu_dehyd_C/PF16912_5/1_8e09Glu_dehyd_C/PF16912_5/1_8e13AlaDh_PNT_C/PF01262_21/0_00035AlaDh_PNT_C/PF01262_21/1e062Hacid_dh_C/PF02826_19/0_00452Hacid_dh_C/PF02826_19/1_5e06ADH_zinc_N_2/PF13602_6/0